MSKNKAELHAVNNPNVQPSKDGMSEQMRESIQLRAYELYQHRGSEPGHDVEDWIRAEAEIMEQAQLNRAA